MNSILRGVRPLDYLLAAGATDLRLYHAGLASPADHVAQREVADL